jgi:intraflagellar transport protein 88
MYSEAMHTYELIIKNKMCAKPGHLRVNMANILYTRGDYRKAVKFYKMALDQV